MAKLSNPMRDVLIEHIDGPVALDAKIKSDPLIENRNRALRLMAIRRCLDHGWLEVDAPVSPTCTIMTDSGRETLCSVLAEWADALNRAHWGLDRLLPDVAGEIAESEKFRKDL